MRVAVVGLGRAGSTLACLLADRGVDVVVLEQEADGPAARRRRPPAARVLPRRGGADAVPPRCPSRRQSGGRRARRRRGARDESAARHRHLARAAHVRWYQWWTRLMMPVFQTDLTPLGWPRDLIAPYVMKVPGVRSQVVTTLTGDRTSPWSTWPLPEAP